MWNIIVLYFAIQSILFAQPNFSMNIFLPFFGIGLVRISFRRVPLAGIWQPGSYCFTIYRHFNVPHMRAVDCKWSDTPLPHDIKFIHRDLQTHAQIIATYRHIFSHAIKPSCTSCMFTSLYGIFVYNLFGPISWTQWPQYCLNIK